MAHGHPLDALAVSLDDAALREELELLIRMFLAANDSEGPLSPEQVDELLGVTPTRIHEQRKPSDVVELTVVRRESPARPRATSERRSAAIQEILAT